MVKNIEQHEKYLELMYKLKTDSKNIQNQYQEPQRTQKTKKRHSQFTLDRNTINKDILTEFQQIADKYRWVTGNRGGLWQIGDDVLLGYKEWISNEKSKLNKKKLKKQQIENDNKNLKYNESLVELTRKQVEIQEKQNQFNLILAIGILISSLYYLGDLFLNFVSSSKILINYPLPVIAISLLIICLAIGAISLIHFIIKNHNK